MIFARILSALAASALFTMVVAQDDYSKVTKPIPSPTTTKPASAMETVGCFETGVPLENHGPAKYQSPGMCQLICIGEDKPVMGLTDGTNCWCGDYIPPASGKVDDSNCETTCAGTKLELCGGNKHWWVVLTGQSRNKIENYDPKKHATTSSTSSATPTTAAPQKTSAEETVVVTAPAEPQEDDSKSKGPNKAGIAAGVVVGVVVLAAIIAGVVFFLRQKKRRELEEEHRRQAATTSFISGGKLHTSNSSMTDSRLDPEYFANRRSSNGSIADNEDYSRRILKVTNA